MNTFEMKPKPRNHETTGPSLSRRLVIWSRGLAVLWSCCLVVLAGCTLAPKYERPAPAISTNWPAPPVETGTATNTATVPAADIGWRDFFRDPRLQRLIELALTNNPDLRVAVLNVEQSRAQYRIQGAALYPEINATASGSRQRLPGVLSGHGAPLTTSLYRIDLGTTSYELDLFGKVRSLKAEALENYFASMETQRSARIALVTQVAIAGLLEYALTEELNLARQTLAAVSKSYELTRSSYEAGVVSELDLRTAEGQVQTAKSNVAALEQQQAQARNNLVFLVGLPLPADLPPPQPVSSAAALPDLPAGLPSDLLLRRPDILAAEHQLKAANASIGAARAAFFPSLKITATGGIASGQLEDLFDGNSRTWIFSPEITLPIFTAGKNRAELDVAKIGKLIEVANYQKAIQTAFREVADDLAVQATVNVQIDAANALIKAEQRRYELADARFRQGVDNYLTVLTAQQDFYSAQQSFIQFQTTRLFNLINLYQALGGGWQENTTTNAVTGAK
jgi:outer membrane protein, multidrug efflux system